MKTPCATLPLLIFSLTCGADDMPNFVTDEVRIDSIRLQILAVEDSCKLRYWIGDSSEVLDLEPKAPCFFLRRGEQSPQYFRYPQVGAAAVLIVAGTSATHAERATWGLDSRLVCGSERQGVVISQDSIRATARILREGIACKDLGADEKDFWLFGHE